MEKKGERKRVSERKGNRHLKAVVKKRRIKKMRGGLLDSLGYLDHKCKLEDETHFYTNTHTHTNKDTERWICHFWLYQTYQKLACTISILDFLKLLEAKLFCIYGRSVCLYVNQFRHVSNDFHFNIRGKLSVILCYTWFFSMAENRF